MAAYREAIEAAIAAVAEAGEGGRAYRHLRPSCSSSSRRASRRSRSGAAGSTSRTCSCSPRGLLERTEIGGAYRSRFSHLLVDEFQDTNRLQLRLIEALRGPATQLMVVGDELQSIYGFRHADLDVFRERREAIEADPGGEAIELTGNFRSRPEVIGAVNALGEKLLGDDYRPLRVGAAPQRAEPARRGPGGRAAAHRPRGLGRGRDRARAGHRLRAPRPTSWPRRASSPSACASSPTQGVDRGAMVVLLRAFTHLDAYEDSLERAGLRPYVVGGRGYWSQQQVADVCALLATIANPLDDQALFGALASPACGVAARHALAAARGRRAGPPRLADGRAGGGARRGRARRPRAARRRSPRTELAAAAPLRRDARRAAPRAPPRSPSPGLIDAAVTETGYDLAVLMRPAGEARFANVRKLMRIADEFEAARGPRPARPARLPRLPRAEADADAQAATAVEDHDGVRIMTIHSAKGLEFDVVAVPHLVRGLLPAAWTPAAHLRPRARSRRVGMQLRRLGARASQPLRPARALARRRSERDAEEELRLFHVAATRARERLLLSGVINPIAGVAARPSARSVVERIVDRLRDRPRGATRRSRSRRREPRPGLEADASSPPRSRSASTCPRPSGPRS